MSFYGRGSKRARGLAEESAQSNWSVEAGLLEPIDIATQHIQEAKQKLDPELAQVLSPGNGIGQRSICPDTARQHVRLNNHPAVKIATLQQREYLRKVDASFAQGCEYSVPDRGVKIHLPLARFG
jgi:hypothetical protein